MNTENQISVFKVFKFVLIAYGFVTIVSQVILMRDLVSIFYGNELSLGMMLGVWLFWSAVGSGFLGKRIVRTTQPIHCFAGMLFLLAFVFPLTLYLNRISPRLVDLSPGEITGLLPIITIPTVTLSLYCLCSGALFTLACRIYRSLQPREKAPVGKVYILEAIGAASGGAFASFFLLNKFSVYEAAALLSAGNTALGVFFLIFRQFRKVFWALGLIAVFFLALFPLWLKLTHLLEQDANQRYWDVGTVVRNENSFYGALTVTSVEDTYSFYENGLLMFSVPDLFYAEEAVHLTLLQHAAPKNVLLIGGGVGGCLQQILAHPTVQKVDYVDLDPKLIEVARTVLPAQQIKELDDPRVQSHIQDGRLFLKNAPEKFDVIITNLPDPSSTLLNRFYTLEFFQEVRQQLKSDGVFGFQISSAENYISDNLARFIRCIYRTLELAFENVIIIPGITNYLLASPTPEVLSENPDKLIARIKQRQLQPEFVNEYYLPFRMSPERLEYLKAKIQENNNYLINRDFKPVAYFFDMLLWSGQTNPVFRNLFDWIAQYRFTLICLGLFAGLIIVLTIWYFRKQQRITVALTSSVVLAGFSQIGLEVNLILAFQALYGYAYHLVTLIVAGFMVGMTAGGWLAARLQTVQKILWRNLIVIQLALVAVPIFLGGSFQLPGVFRIETFSTVVIEMFFLGLAVLSGFCGGYLFPVTTSIAVQTGKRPERAGGTLYGFDLLGACLGALLTSAFLVPLFGIYQTLFLFSLLNALGLSLTILTYRVNVKTSFSKPARPLRE